MKYEPNHAKMNANRPNLNLPRKLTDAESNCCSRFHRFKPITSTCRSYDSGFRGMIIQEYLRWQMNIYIKLMDISFIYQLYYCFQISIIGKRLGKPQKTKAREYH